MIKTILTLAFAGVTGAAGYLGGSVYPAPPEIIDKINSRANDLRTQLKLEKVDITGLRSLVTREKFDELSSQIQTVSAAAGEIIVVDRENSSREEELANLALSEEEIAAAAPTPPPAPSATSPSPAAPPGGAAAPTREQVFLAALELCPRMKIENAPAADANLRVSSYKPFVRIKGVKIATDPSLKGCLSSGYGTRSSRLHKGVDYHSETGGPIVAAGDGAILEMRYRNDYGNMVLIDHGGGVYTRYAHLASFGQGLSSGVKVRAGEQIGLMGNTAAYPVPIHLHYEVLLGDYFNPKSSFGLESTDVFSHPSAT